MKTIYIIKETHRGLKFIDGVFAEELGAGRYTVEPPLNLGVYRRPQVEIVLVDMRERDLTIKGQEILTADKVAIRVSIVVRFRVVNARAAMTAVENYEDRIYTDVQLAARRSLAAMQLEQILTNRNQLSEDILRDITGISTGYGVEIVRADVKDLVFPGNIQEVMNRVLAADRVSQAQLIEARTRAEVQRIDAEAKKTVRLNETEAQAQATKRAAEAEAEAQQIRTAAEIAALREREQAATAYSTHPALLRLAELAALGDLTKSNDAKIILHFGHSAGGSDETK